MLPEISNVPVKMHAFSCISSSFLASSNSFGTPCGLVWALKHRFHKSLQKGAVSLSRKPVSWIWRDLTSGWRKETISSCAWGAKMTSQDSGNSRIEIPL